jgi:hypothetical protein
MVLRLYESFAEFKPMLSGNSADVEVAEVTVPVGIIFAKLTVLVFATYPVISVVCP